MMFRLTRTIVRGQFSNEACFAQWIAASVPAVQLVKIVPDPLNNGGPNDGDYFLWVQNSPVATPDAKTCDVSLVTRDGKNGWATQAEAEAVLAAELQQSGAVKATVERAIADAASPEAYLNSILNQAGRDAGKLAAGVPWWAWLLGAGVAAGGVALAVRRR